ncbi:hypothetical protein like AT3G23880 [Hibiscus trionum]|uniref:F-box domain-containing protein n=1 Tax=Hibiscus trionum TaxID=183268 RepID=A0A9W7HL72_HIBTR|nr:hypothetical protein like AT3G23880 [Hibiscus trionum]
MSDYMPVELVIGILKRLPVKSLVRFRSVCKSWNTLFTHPCFISTHLQSSLSNNTPFLLLNYRKNGKHHYFLHYDNDGVEELKQLQFPEFGYAAESPVVGSCNGLICVLLHPFRDFHFLLWNPSIQKYISLPSANGIECQYINFGFGFDSRTNDYKLLIVGVDEYGNWIQPYLFSFNENCWRKVTAAYPNYAVVFGMSMPFVNGALHWLGHRKRNEDELSIVISGFDLSAGEFFKINLPESFIGLWHFDLSIMKYGESSIAAITHPRDAELNELWVMKEYGVVESWTKLFTLHTSAHYPWFPIVLEFRKNGEVLLEVDDGKMASLDLNCQAQQMELHGVEVGSELLNVNSYVESLVMLDKTVDIRSESAVNHPIDSTFK